MENNIEWPLERRDQLPVFSKKDVFLLDLDFGVWLLFLASSRQVGKLEGENFGNVCSLQYRVGLQVWGLRLLESFMFF